MSDALYLNVEHGERVQTEVQVPLKTDGCFVIKISTHTGHLPIYRRHMVHEMPDFESMVELRDQIDRAVALSRFRTIEGTETLTW